MVIRLLIFWLTVGSRARFWHQIWTLHPSWDWIDVKYPTLLHNWAAIKIQNIHNLIQIQSPVPGIINILNIRDLRNSSSEYENKYDSPFSEEFPNSKYFNSCMWYLLKFDDTEFEIRMGRGLVICVTGIGGDKSEKFYVIQLWINFLIHIEFTPLQGSELNRTSWTIQTENHNL